MSTQSNAMPESSLKSQVIAPPVNAATRPFYWSVRRELWEYRCYLYSAAGRRRGRAVWLFDQHDLAAASYAYHLNA